MPSTLIHPELLKILRCPESGLPLVVNGDGLKTKDGLKNYPVVAGIPLLISQSALRTHEGINALFDENSALVHNLNTMERGQIDQFISDMLVPTCGNLFQGVRLNNDYPIAHPSFHPGTLIDIGCNWGRWSIGGALQGRRVIGVDLHLKALICAKYLAEKLTPNNQPMFVACDARHLPFADNTFDEAFSYSVLQHFNSQNLKHILSEIRRTLRDGGGAEIQMPNKLGIKAQLDRLVGREPVDVEFNVRYYSIDQLLKIFNECIGPSTFSADCFLGLNVHRRDRRFVSLAKKLIIDISSGFKELSRIIPSMALISDSIIIRSQKKYTNNENTVSG